MLIYDLSIRSLVTESGIPDTRKPSLVFGDRTTWGIRILNAGQPADLSGVTAWAAAVAEDLNPLTMPLCRTQSGISEEEGVVAVPLDARNAVFCEKTQGRSPRTCVFELAGLDGDGRTVMHIDFPVVCRMAADPMSTGDLPPIEVTDMTSAQVQAVARGAAREEVAEIQGEIEQAKQDAEEAAEAAQEAAESIPTTEGATAGDVLTVGEDGSASYQPPQGGAWGGITGTLSDQTDLQEALDEKATEAFVNSSINALAAFPITRDAQKDPFRTRGELLNATTYYSGGEVRVPTRNDYAFVQSDEYYGTVVDGYTDFALTEEYVGYYVLDGYEKTLVTAENKDDLGIVPGTTVPYVELPSTRYIYNGTGFEFQFIVNQSGLTAVQLAALNSGITAEKVASMLTGVKVVGAEILSTDGIVNIPRADRYAYGAVRAIYNSRVAGKSWGAHMDANGIIGTIPATEAEIDEATASRVLIAPNTVPYAVRSVSPLVTALPANAASPIALTDASATTRNHSWTYTHAPAEAPTYQLPAVTDTTITHEIVLYLDLTSTASFSFTDSEGETIAVDTNGVTPALGECWTLWAEYIHGAWIVRGMKDKEATA